ncbi:MAG TPA: protein-export chaperone SecB [Micavibrio sp.]
MIETAAPADAQSPEIAAARALPLTIHAQYIRDASFENPNVPHILKADAGRPDMKMNISMNLQEIDDKDFPGMYEVALRLRTTAKRGEKTAFIAEVDYAASVTVGKDVPEETIHPLLMIEVPRLLFPFARQVLVDLTQGGGFPPVLIAPVDFQGLYLQRFAKEIEAGQQKKAAG